MNFNNIRVDAVEYGVYSYPKHMEGWRCYRLEYGGHAENCVHECVIWLPPNMPVSELEDLIAKYTKDGYTLDHITYEG